MASKTSKYWDDRALRRLTGAEKTSEEYIKRVRKMYDKAYRDLNKDIETIYKNYSKDTGIDVDTLKTLLTKKETDKVFKELKAKGYDKYVKDNYKSRITRLEQLKAQIYAKAKDVYSEEELINHQCYSEVYKNSYYKAIYDTQMGTGYNFGFGTIDDNIVKAVLNERWSGKNYKARVWGNTDILAESVSEIVGASILNGQSLSKTSKEIRERFGVGKYYAERLIRTETNHFYNEADAMAYEEMGIDKYVFVAVLDNRTSRMCQDMDNVVKDYKDKEVGVNFPPLHPNCRSTTRGYLGEEAERHLQRRARDPKTGKSELIGNMSYKEWAKTKGIDVAVTKRGGQLPAKPVVDTSKSVVPKVKPLTETQKEALKYYVSGEGMYVNNALRGINKDLVLNDKDMELIKDLDEATNRPLGKQTLYRSVDASVIFKDINDFDYEDLRGYLNYGAKGTYETNKFNKLMSTQVKEFKDLGFVSTTKDYNIARDWGGFTGSSRPIVLELNIDDTVKGVDLDFLDLADDPQKETLLARNQVFKVKDITAKDGSIYVKVDVTSGDVLKDKVKDTVKEATKDVFKTENLPAWFKDYKGNADEEAKLLTEWLNKNGNPKSKASKVFNTSIKDIGNGNGKISKQAFTQYKEGKGSFVRDTYTNDIVIPRITNKDNPVGSIQTVLHENWHAIDYYKGDSGKFLSNLSDNLKKVVRNDDNKIGADVTKLFEEYNKQCKDISTRISKEYHYLFEEINKKWDEGKYKSYRSYTSAWSKARSKIKDMIDYEERNLMGGGINNLQDIYDSLSAGYLRDSNVVKYGHGRKYFRKGGVDSQVREIVANYGALSMTRPDLIDMLKADKPNLVDELETLLDMML